MLNRLYIHNYRGLDNFELSLRGLSSALLIGKNGSGKTTVGQALEILQKIAQGGSRFVEVVDKKDFTREQMDIPMRFEIEVELQTSVYIYTIVFELPKDATELQIAHENLSLNGRNVFTREGNKMHVGDGNQHHPFQITVETIGLSIIQSVPVSILKQWLGRLLILRPIPSLMSGETDQQKHSPYPHTTLTNFGAWFSALTQQFPATYSNMYEYLKQISPDLKEIQNVLISKNALNLEIHFSNNYGTLKLDFGDLSDGEKCFMLAATVIASSEVYQNTLCFWDEPDNYLSLDEVGHFVMALRRAFRSGEGQLIVTSHNPEAIRRFSDENTFVLHRSNHFEPTLIHPLSELRANGKLNGDLISALIRGDVYP